MKRVKRPLGVVRRHPMTRELLERYSLVGMLRKYVKFYRPFGPVAHDSMNTTTDLNPRPLNRKWV